MPAQSFIAGLLKGFGTRASEGRAESLRAQELQDAKEEKILTTLASSDDEEVSTAATVALLNRAAGMKPPKGGFLAQLMGPQTAAHPAVASLLKLAQSPVTREVPGAPINVPTGPVGGFQPLPPTGTPPSPSSPSQTPPGPPPQPPGMPPGSAAMAPPPQVGGPPTPGMLPSPGNPPPLPPDLITPKVGAGVPTMKTTGSIGMGRLPGTTVTEPRKLLLSTTERVFAEAKARAAAGPIGEFEGMVASGIPEDQARAFMLAKARRAAGARDSYAEGEIVRNPDGTWEQILYNRYDPTDQIRIPAVDPGLKSVAPTNTDAQLADELFGPKYPGLSPNQILASLSPAERRQMYAERLKRTTATAFASGTGSGQAAINTAGGMPIGPGEAAVQGVSAGTSIAGLGQRVPLMPDQRQRLNAASEIEGNLNGVQGDPKNPSMEDLIRSVFPAGGGLQGSFKTGTTLLYKAHTGDPAYNALDARVWLLLSKVSRVVSSERGASSENDAKRAEAALAQLKNGFFSGTTQETALARVQELRNALVAVRAAIEGGGGGAGGGVAVVGKDGVTYHFPTQAAADAFKKAGGG